MAVTKLFFLISEGKIYWSQNTKVHWDKENWRKTSKIKKNILTKLTPHSSEPYAKPKLQKTPLVDKIPTKTSYNKTTKNTRNKNSALQVT